MHVHKTLNSDTEAAMVVSANEADLSPFKQQVLQKLAPQVKVPGFRAGKTPLAMVEKNLDQNLLQSEVLQEAVSALYSQALDQERLRPVDRPQISIKKFVPFIDLEFEATVQMVGEVTLPDYKKFSLDKPPLEITDADVDEVVEALRKRSAERSAVERAAKNGDEVLIDFKGTDKDGKAIAGADGKAYPLTLGSDAFIPGFERNLIGLKAGASKTFTIPFPKDYSVKALQGKEVTFAVTIQTVNELKLPKIDADFAAKSGPFKTVAELRKDIKARVEQERQYEADRAYENNLLKQLAAKTTVALPKSMVDEQIERIERDEMQNLLYRGQTFEEHLKEEGVTHEEHREQKREGAEERVKIGILLSEIAEAEQLTVTPEEFDLRMQLLRGQYTDAKAQEDLSKPEVQRDIVAQMLTEKTMERLVSYATKKK